jgi:hypothetical protein
MKKLKKLLRLLVLICLLVLASFGIGLNGGVPLPVIKRKNSYEEVRIELIDKKDKVSETTKIQIKE